MQFKTSISQTKAGKHFVRNIEITDLIQKHTFVETIFLLLRGNLPEKREQDLMDSLLVAATENGLEAPSLYMPRVAAASGNEFHVALAAGMLAIGERHGGAAERAAIILNSGKTAEQIVAEHKIIAGFGHKVYKDEDPRAKALEQRARDLGFSGKYFNLAHKIRGILKEIRGKDLPLNIDGALACCMLELGFDPRLGKGLFLVSRIVGMSAHILEEFQQGNSYYRLGEDEIIYNE